MAFEISKEQYHSPYRVVDLKMYLISPKELSKKCGHICFGQMYLLILRIIHRWPFTAENSLSNSVILLSWYGMKDTCLLHEEKLG